MNFEEFYRLVVEEFEKKYPGSDINNFQIGWIDVGHSSISCNDISVNIAENGLLEIY